MKQLKPNKTRHYFITRYYRKPYPSGNWCDEVAFVYDGKGKRLAAFSKNSYPIPACNVVSWVKNDLQADWDHIHDMGEIEITPSAFKTLAARVQ